MRRAPAVALAVTLPVTLAAASLALITPAAYGDSALGGYSASAEAATSRQRPCCCA